MSASKFEKGTAVKNNVDISLLLKQLPLQNIVSTTESE